MYLDGGAGDCRAGLIDLMRSETWPRHLPLNGTYNVRDVGGYASAVGRATRWRTLFRADSLHRLDAAAQSELLEHGIRTIVDLRHGGEILAAPNMFQGSTRVAYVHAPLLEDPSNRAASGGSATRTLEETYRIALRARNEQLVAILRLLTEPTALPALVHCTAGKDRTGLVVALALAAVGVPDETIADDYARSEEFLVGAYFDEARQRAESRGIPWEVYRANLVCPAPLMLGTLTWLRDEYGSIDDYLLHSGLSRVNMLTLRELLTE